MNHSLSTLFVSIASYRDPELIPTLKNMLQTAAYPERLHISVCWQDDNDIKQFLNQGFTVVFVEGMDNGALYKLSFAGVVIDVISLHYYTSQGRAGRVIWPKRDLTTKTISCKSIPTAVLLKTGIRK